MIAQLKQILIIYLKTFQGQSKVIKESIDKINQNLYFNRYCLYG